MAIGWTLFILRSPLFVFLFLAHCAPVEILPRMLSLLFISFYNALGRTPTRPRPTPKWLFLSRLSFVLWNLQKSERHRFHFISTERRKRCVWVSRMVTTIHLNLTSHCGGVTFGCRVFKWSPDTPTSAAETMPAWSQRSDTRGRRSVCPHAWITVLNTLPVKSLDTLSHFMVFLTFSCVFTL